MDNKERLKMLLIDGLNEFDHDFTEVQFDSWVEHFSESLSNAGVIVPKFNVGHKVYRLATISNDNRKQVVEHEIIGEPSIWYPVEGYHTSECRESALFATKAEAEAALKGADV